MARGKRSGSELAVALGGLLLGACISNGSYSGTWRAESPPLTTAAILAPVPPHPDAELARLERLGDEPAPLLRRAYIFLESGETRHALELGNRVLYGMNTPSPAEEALALYIRAEAYQALGDRAGADRDRARALELALDGELRDRLLAAAPAPEVVAAPVEAAPSLAVLPRSSWNARPSRRDRLNPMGRIYRLTIHHSAMPMASTSPGAAAGAIRDIQRNHLRDAGYGDIGYHYIIDPAGRIWAGREARWQGAHAMGANNRGNLGVCLLGNFVPGPGGQEPTPAQIRALRRFTARLSRQHRIPVSQIYTHGEMRPTDCPGALLQAQVDRMRRDLRVLAQQDSKPPQAP